MTATELEENGRRLDLIDRLKKSDGSGIARILHSQSEAECVALARHADQIGHRTIGAAIWNHIRKAR